MSEVVTKRRPMIDLDEFERRLCPPRSTDQRDGDPLAELLRIIGDKNEQHKTDFESKNQIAARARQDTGEPSEGKQPAAQVRLVSGDFATIEAGLLGTTQPRVAILPDAERLTADFKRPNARAPLISGDFAAIEAALLGSLREQATATVSETDMSNAFPSVDLGSDSRLYQDNQLASRHGGGADGHIRSRRPLYVMAAIAIAGMAGIAVSFGLNSRLSGPPEIASIKADNGPDKQQTDAISSADIPAQDAAILSKPQAPSPIALDNGTKQPLDLPQAGERTPAVVSPIESQAPIESESAAAPTAPTPTELHSTMAPVAPDTVKTNPVQPDGTLPNGTLPGANINGAQLPAPQSPAAAKAPTVKAAGRMAKPLTPATVRHPGSHGQPRQIANKAKATPLSPPTTTGPAPSANNPIAETPTAQPSPVTNGAFDFVQNAVNSLSSTTTKLFEWGRN
jgi:hypothetical protein